MKRIFTFLLLIAICVQVHAVSFTLLNKSIKSIPLWIPSVMNPNLSPFSSSGVSLDVGQEIFFKYNGRKKVLLVVSEELDGDEVDVVKLIKVRTEELDAERAEKK